MTRWLPPMLVLLAAITASNCGGSDDDDGLGGSTPVGTGGSVATGGGGSGATGGTTNVGGGGAAAIGGQGGTAVGGQGGQGGTAIGGQGGTAIGGQGGTAVGGQGGQGGTAIGGQGGTAVGGQGGTGIGGQGGASSGPEVNVKQGTTNLLSGSGQYKFPAPVAVSSASAVTTITIENLGNQPLNVTNISLSQGDTSQFNLALPGGAGGAGGAGAVSLQIAASGSEDFGITFEPTNGGIKVVQLTIINDDADEGTYTFSVRGDTSPNLWRQLGPATSPPARFNHDMVHADNGQIVMFGGRQDSSTIYNDTWIYDIAQNSWTELSPATSPDQRFAHAMAYGAGKVVLFGGTNAGMGGTFEDTWEFDINTKNWTEITPTTAPGIQYKHQLVYVGNNKFMMYGGFDEYNEPLGDTWEYDLTTHDWTSVPPPTSSPGPLAAFGMTGTPTGALLFGGVDDTWYGSDKTWQYDASAQDWTQLTFATSPAARINHRAQSVDNGQVVVFSGYDYESYSFYTDTWVYTNATNTWVNAAPATAPDARLAYGFAYGGQAKAILFGGNLIDSCCSAVNDTWEYVAPTPPTP